MGRAERWTSAGVPIEVSEQGDATMREAFCPECGTKFLSPTKAEMVCDGCLEKRRAKLREIEAANPSAESLGLVGSKGEPLARLVRPTENSGGRVIRKTGGLS
jgi:hypothetical protein